MINVNQITSMLAKLPDQALQQYAAMHKNDPYTVSLAVAESNRRKEMRAGAQAQRGQMPQTEVIKQEIAAMFAKPNMSSDDIARAAYLMDKHKEAEFKEFTRASPTASAAPMPEDQGIAQLPAGDMDFADGGIVAFDGGGRVTQADVQKAYDDWMASQKSWYQQSTPLSQKNEAAAKANYEQLLSAFQTQPTNVQPGAPTPIGATFTPGGESGLRPQDSAALNQASKQASNQASNAAANQQERGLGAAARVAGIRGMDVEGLTRRALDEAEKMTHPQANEIEAIGKEKVAAKEEYAKGIAAINKQFEDIYKGREERLNKREGDISTMKDQNLGLALLQAGAAMMTTPGGIGQAVGKGVDVGSKQYATGIERVRSAQEKLYDARDRLEELNAQRGELSAREQLKAENEVKATSISAREDLVKANMDMFKVNRETALKMVDNQIKVGIAQFEQSSANARASRPGETLQITQEYDRIMAEKGKAAADAFLERVGVVRGLGKTDPMTKDPRYIAAAKEAEEAYGNALRLPAGKARDAELARAKALEERAEGYLRGGNRAVAGVNSELIKKADAILAGG